MDLFQLGQEVTVYYAEDKTYVEGFIKLIDENENKLLIKPVKAEHPIRKADMDDVVSINDIPRARPVYYQPRLSDEEWATGKLSSFEVYRHYEHCKEDYPDNIIDRYVGSEIENHSYVDDEDYRSQEFFVDMPNHDDSGDSSNMYATFCEEDARVFAQVHFGADENGFINILSNS
jgi:hypothetical protein